MNFCPYCGETIRKVENKRLPNNLFIKCPNCGHDLNQVQSVCEYCGFQVPNKRVASSVQNLANHLLQIENERNSRRKMRRNISDLFDHDARFHISDTAAREVTLIKSAPIPNTVEELTEFMFLAEANINVSLSKDTLMNRLNRDPNWNYPNDDQHISDAWVSKMQQIYRKAEYSFGKTPEFQHIKKIYDNKMRELKMEPGS